MLKLRLLFGALMIILFVGLVLFDGHFDGSLRPSIENKPIQGTLLCVLIALLAVPATIEMSNLTAKTGAKIFKPVVIAASIAIATSWYWRQFSYNHREVFHLYFMLFVLIFSIFGMFLYQARRFGTENVIANCGAGLLAILYLGFLSGFVLAVRVEFGMWHTLMFIFTVKSSDTGAYAMGRLFGKHKFSPRISPGKTWEGMAGAVLLAAVVAVAFSVFCGIMSWPAAIAFGAIFAFLGQLGDLAESMLKRDAQQKDSSGTVPGFGGVLDVIDSPLVTAPVAYLFFMLISR